MSGEAGGRITDYYPKESFRRRYPDLASAAAGLTSASGRLCDLLAELPAEAIGKPLAPGKWSPSEVADHLVLGNRLFTDCFTAARSSTAAPYRMPRGELSVEGKPVTPPEGEPRPGRDRLVLIAELHSSTEALVAAADESPHLDVVCLVHAFFGDMNVEECVQLAAWHMTHHLRQLESARRATDE